MRALEERAHGARSWATGATATPSTSPPRRPAARERPQCGAGTWSGSRGRVPTLLGALLLPVAADRESAARAELCELDGRLVGWFRLEGGKRRGAVGPTEGETIERLVRMACDAGVPIVGVLATSGADLTEGGASLHAWGRVARAMSEASGMGPVVLCVVGPCVSGPSLLLGLADAVVMTADAFAYVSGPSTVAAMTGCVLDHDELGGSDLHRSRSGVATLVVDDEDALLWAVADLLAYLPSNNCDAPPAYTS